ncbi:2-keto-4-pentenoate hydratase [Aspergillus pseudotamarii]|uniref:2-keto-4-pentenoate hydratase n=1 Tax=Aspergillus pseudotamarii TaxID=132259 RepID=A0A5N6T657_ASPPS|nr:2-keto-4-pentenoate hydratase [Aspergillus pseudotamarii]KAE8141780.1 2-keto-4-pentenoate hydratase [Aspergillus pseudotamarii]
MPSWTHLVRFVASEDDQVHLGQLVDPTRDVGLDSINGIPIYAFKVEGTIYNGRVTETSLQVRQLLSPIVPEECPYIRCIGLNYKLHALEAGMPIPTVPALFSKPRTTIANPYPGTINIPKIAQDNSSDYEAELVIVIGKSARDITAEQAPWYILGYTAANDVSARDMQMKTPMPCFSKGMDSSCPLGPVLVSTAVIPDPQDLEINAIYNNKTVQEGHTSDMIFGVCELIAYLSQGTTIEPGTIILTGTPSGIGYFRSPRIFLGDGDEIRVCIERIGSLVNKVHYE